MTRLPSLEQPQTGGQEVVVGGTGFLAVVRSSTRRVLRDHSQGQSLGQCQAFRILAVVNQAGSRHTLHIAAIGNSIEVCLKDLILGIPRLKYQGGHDLADFPREMSGVDSVVNAGKLHRDGGTTQASSPGDVGRPDGAQQCIRVHPRVQVKPAVFLEEGGLDQQRAQPLQRTSQTILFILRQRQSQEVAFSVVNCLRETDAGEQRRPVEAPIPNSQQYGEYRNQPVLVPQRTAPHCDQGPSTTIVLPSPRA